MFQFKIYLHFKRLLTSYHQSLKVEQQESEIFQIRQCILLMKITSTYSINRILKNNK
ncbi:unnamed protein product [Paramecium sonneborni]|uniref:Uncharacterized protein n=1 Tax=Paramecium sonneborni TaxID=65129 RepID=A0A8S1RMK5_9CILI|nr:unnamed protein product [Paramecium sonneborni]